MAIRGEKDRKRIAGFGKEEKRIYEQWRAFGKSRRTGTSAPTSSADGLQMMLEGMFG